MDIDGFYEFSSKLSSATFQVGPVNLKSEKCSQGNSDGFRLLRGEYYDISFPIVFLHESGRMLEDVLDTGWPGLFLISDSLKNILVDNDLTGWQTFETKILDKQQVEIGGYCGLSVIGRCGEIDYNKSEIKERRRKPTTPIVKYHKGLYVGLDKWDGSDFFLPLKSHAPIVTKRVVDILMKNKITNVRFTNLSDIEIPDYGLPNNM